MEGHSPLSPSYGDIIMGGTASPLAVVALKGIDPDTNLAEIQSIFTGTNALSWDLHFDQQSSQMTLEVRFQNKECAESYIAKYNGPVVDGDLPPGPTLGGGQWSPSFTASTMSCVDTPDSTTVDGPVSQTASTIGIDIPSDAIPWPGNTYKIKHRTSGRLITLVEGRLELQLPEMTKGAGGWQWACIETGGWLGFRNSVSGTYMGHDSRGKIMAKVNHHQAHEHFCVRRHPEGSFVILVKHNNDELWQMACDEKSGTLVEKKNSDDQWLFEVM